jgi:hypothetical protein
MSSKNTVTYPGFAWLIRRVLDLMIEFIGRLYNRLQQFTNHYLTHSHLLPTGHSTGIILTSNWTPLYSVLLLQFWSELRLTVPFYNSSARTPRKTPSTVVKNTCLLFRYLAVNVLLLLIAYASGMCVPSRCLAVSICVTILRPVEYPWTFSFDLSWGINCTPLLFTFDNFEVLHSAAKIDIGVDDVCSFETLAGDTTFQITWRHAPKDCNIILQLAAKFL